jgi:hypothetical protein
MGNLSQNRRERWQVSAAGAQEPEFTFGK